MLQKLLKGLAVLVCLLPMQFASAAVENYTFDTAHTYVLWHINHFGFSNPSGKWYANGTLAFDDAKPQDSKVTVKIDVASLDTGNPELDKHLKSANFFDVKQFPDATFVSNKVTKTGKNSAKVQGLLTLHGVTKPITLNILLNKTGENPITNKMTMGFSATGKLKRSDFGMNSFLPGLSDDVTLNIEAEAYKG